MLSQTTAFVTRSIRQESRLLSHHLVRGGLALLTLYLLGLQVISSARMGASGYRLIAGIMNCCYWCLTLLGVMYFSVAITEEKEEETLPLLRMTGVRNITLLLGKSLPRLAVVILLILVATPFLMLAVTLGGVVPEQIFASLIGLTCYAFCLSQVGLFASTVSRNSSAAVRWTVLLWLLLEFGHWMFMLMAFGCDEWGLHNLAEWFQWLAGSLGERTMWQASSAYLMFERGESIWHPQMTFHLTVGAIFFGLSYLLFERFTQHAISQGAAATVATARGIFNRTNIQRSLRCWDAAMEWKSWQFVAGGWFWFWVWMISLPVLSVTTVIAISAMVGEVPPAEAFGWTLIIIGTAGLAIQLGRLFGNVLNREIYDQTLVSLCMLPKKRGVILHRMILGVLPFLIPPLVCISLGFLWNAAAAPRFVVDTSELFAEPWFWASLSWVIVTVHLGTFLSVYFRHGGMLVAVAVCWFVMPFIGGMTIAAIATIFRGGGPFQAIFQYVIPMFAILGNVVICIVLQKMTLRRVEEVAGK